MTIHNLPLSPLTPYKNNAKIHNKKQIETIAKSLEEFGWQQPIVVDRDNIIIAGHGRYEAAKLLGLETAPVKYDDNTEIEMYTRQTASLSRFSVLT